VHDPFAKTIHSLEKRAASVKEIDFDIARATQLVSVFNCLRLFYPRPYLCLFDSLALLEFLAHHGLSPKWIFGVRGEPFEAHCWLQTRETVLNDTVERASSYYTIMTI
jgi:hypothetical protein